MITITWSTTSERKVRTSLSAIAFARGDLGGVLRLVIPSLADDDGFGLRSVEELGDEVALRI